MRLLGYYIAHTFVNSIKKLLKTWVAFLLLFIVVCAIFGGIFGFVISGLVENNQSESENSTIEESKDEEEHSAINKSMTAEEKILRNQVIEVVIFLIVMTIVLFNVYNGNKSGTEIFTMADVNFLFASPKKPQSVLLFKVVLQMGAILLGSLYLCFQIPNLVLNLGLSLKAAFGFMVAWIMTLLLGKLLSIMTYTLSATYVTIQKYVKPMVIGVLLCLVFLYVIALQQHDRDYLSAVLSLFASEKTSYIPMIGWIKGFAMALVRGEELGMVCYFCLLMLGYLFLIVIIWKIKADFYEDALVGAAKMQDRLEAAKRGMGVKKRKKQKNVKEEVIRGEGAAVFFGKQYLNRVRFAKGRVITNTMLFYAVTSTMLVVFALKVVQTNEIAVVGISILILAFLRNFGNPIVLETKRNYIYMVPDKPFKKISYAVLAGSFEAMLDMLPGFVIATIIMHGDVWYALAYYLLILSMDFLVSSTAVFVEMILPVSLNEMIKECFALFLKAFSLIPLLTILIVGIVLKQVVVFLLIAMVFNLVTGFLFLFLSSLTLHRGKN